MQKEWKVGLISGTGEEGLGIALRLAGAGEPVALGSRSSPRAQEAAAGLNRRIGNERITGLTNEKLVESCEILLLTVPFIHAEKVVRQYRNQLQEGQILVDVTVPVVFDKGPRMLDLEQGSGAEMIQSLLPPEIPVVGAFKTLPAHLLCESEMPLDCDEFVCSDSKEARQRVLEVFRVIPALRWIEAGPLRYSRVLEGMTLLAIGLNRRYRVKYSRFQVVGI